MKKSVIVTLISVILVLAIIVGGFYYINYENSPPQISEEKIESEKVFVLETISQAKSRQIKTLYDKVSPASLGDLKSEELCEIEFEKNEISSDEKARGTFTFSESLYGETVYLACDQFERYGITEEELQKVTAGSSKEKLNCDYGRVTTPTIYFYSASDGKDTDYCIAPITINPLEDDEGECFSEEVIDEMKKECEENDKPSFEIPDSNGCATIYCGWDYNICPSEELLKKTENECESKENQVAVRYGEEIDGQDFPCAQVRCSQCPSEKQIEDEKSSCNDKGGVPNKRLDHETGCEFIFCDKNSESGENDPATPSA